MILLPKPTLLQLKEENFTLNYDAYIVIGGECSDLIYKQALLLREGIKAHTGFDLRLSKGVAREGDIRIGMLSEPHPCEQAYQLEVGETTYGSGEGISKQQGILILGTEKSIIHGIQTLLMMISQKGSCLPHLQLFDAPELENRGFFYDMTRGRVATLDTLKWMADKASYYKLNQLHLYVEHSYLFRDFSEVWRDDTPITPEEILELDEYCTIRGIELIPSVATGSHLYDLLRTQTYKHLCELEAPHEKPFSGYDRQVHHTIDISNPDSLQLMKEMISEYRPLFRSNKFNINGDETFDMGKGKSKELCETEGLGKVYVSYMKEIIQHVKSLGCIPMMWGDVIAEHKEFLTEFPEETIFLNWAYHADITDESSKLFHETGVNYMNCPGVQSWRRLVDCYPTAYENIVKMASYAKEHKSIGVLNTAWGDYYHTAHPMFSMIGLIYGASFSWGATLTKEEIDLRISTLEFSKINPNVVSLLSRISEGCLFQFAEICIFIEKNWLPEPLSALSLEEADAKLDQVKLELSQLMGDTYKEVRPLLSAYLIAIDGCKLLNQMGTIVIKKEKLGEKIDSQEAFSLAREIEHWLYHYKALWRDTSKESELYNVQKVYDGCCDYLRDL